MIYFFQRTFNNTRFVMKGKRKGNSIYFIYLKTKTDRKTFIYFFIYLQSIRVRKIWLHLENFWILLEVIFLTSVLEKCKDARRGKAVVGANWNEMGPRSWNICVIFSPRSPLFLFFLACISCDDWRVKQKNTIFCRRLTYQN